LVHRRLCSPGQTASEVAKRKRTAAKPTKNEQHPLGNAEMAESFKGAVDEPLLKR